MNTQNFPVTFEFFKKYTKNHGKYINFIYDFIKTTHPIQYSKRNTTSGNDWALRKYYEKFYLQTAIRRMCPLEFKPVPNFIKDKILQVTNNNRVSNDNTEAAAAPAVTQPGVVLNSNSNQVENSNQVSHDISKAAAAPAVTRPGEVQNSNQVSHDISKAAPAVSQPGELQNTYTAKDDEEHQQIPTTSKNSQLSINTLPLKLPVTFEDFKKHTYYNEIVDKMLKLKSQGNDKLYEELKSSKESKKRALQDYYQAFYCQPKIRENYPIRFKPMPKKLKETFLQIPLADDCNSSANRQDCFMNSDNVEDVPKAINDDKDQQIPTTSKNSQLSSNNNANRQDCFMNSDNVEDVPKEVNDDNDQQIPTTSKNSQLSINTLPLKLPVTYENFKKHTYYNEIVDKMLKLKSQGNDKLYEELKSSKESKKRALQDYYQAFYCQPKIRENYPIRFKPMPKKLKETFLQIPLADDCNSSANRQDCFMNSDNVEDVPKAINDDKDQEIPTTSKNSQLSSNNNANRQDCFMNSNNVEEVPMGVNDDKDAEPLTLATTTTKPSINQVNGKALMPFKHSCPMSCANFRLYTNIEEVLKEKYVKRYGNVKFNEKLKDLAWHYWLIFYLKPEYRTEYPLNQVKVKEEFLDKKAKVFTTTLRNAKIPYNNDNSKKENAKPESNTGNKPAAKDVDPEETSTSRQYDDYAHLPLTPPNKRTNDDSSQPVSKRRKTMSAAPEEQSGIENNNSQKETLKQHEQATNTKNGKHNVEILENLLLVSPLPPPTIRSSVSCSDKRCIFSDISFDDFLQNTNILEMSPQPLSNSELVTIYKKTLYGLVAHKNIPDELVINGKFIADHLLYKDLQICENCKTSFDFLEMEETDQSSHNAMDVHPSTSRSTSNSAGIQKLKRIYCLKKLGLNPLQKCADQLYPLSFEQFKQSSKIPLKKILKEIFNDNNEIIEMFLKDNELRNQLLYYYYINYHTKPSFKTKYPSKFCNTEKLNGDIRQTDEETNKHESNSITTEEPKKHTDTLKSTTLPAKEPINNQIDAGNLQMSSDNSDGKDKSLQKSNPLTHQIVQASPAATTKLGHAENQTITDIPLKLKSQHQNTISADLPQSSSPKNVEYLDKAKRIIFRNKAKEHCLPYILRTSFGLKQNIIIAVFSMTYEEFHNLTRIYEGNSLYNDSHIMQCAYKCIFQTNQVWPTILYMTLHDLCQFLKMKNIIIQNYSTMLKYISPKFLHWSNLRKCTNFEDSVCLYYRKRTGKILNINDEKLLNNECNDYYNRCWIHEKWIEQIPLLNSELVKELEENQSDIPVFDMSLVQEISATVDDAAEMAPANAGEEMPLQNINESPVSDDKNNTSPITQQQQPAIHVDKINLENATPVQNYVLLPNTQHQIDMLPSETTTVDPLQRDSPKNVENLDDGEEPVSFSELSDKIKIEPIEGKLLNNFNFYENDNGEINVSPRDEEIVIVDGTDTSNEENLPPSQIDFSEFCQTSKKLSGSGVLPRSDNSDRSSLTDIRQRLPSSAESTKAQHNIQKLMQLNYDSSSSSSTSGSPKSDNKYNKICLEVQELLEQILIDDDDKKTNVNSNLPQLEEEKDLVLQISDDSDGNSDEMSTIIGNQNVDSNNTKDKLKQLPSSLDFQNFDYATTTATSVQQPSFISPSPRNEATFMEAQRLPSALEDSQNAIEIVQQNNVQFSKSSTGIPDIERYVTIRKKSKNITNLQVATVKPIQKSSEHVPQRQHHIRPLPGASVAQASTTTSHSTKQIQQNQTTNVAQIEATPSLIITSSTEKQSQQTSPPRTYIHISQELTTDCTVFNNSSLLKIADHNYHRQSQQTSSPTTSISQTTRTSPRIITRKVLNYNQSNEASVSTTHLPSTSSSISAETNRPVEITTRKSPLNKDNNLKVNTLTNSNLVATIPPTVHFSGNETMHKLCVYRDLNSIHYFKEISSQHIATYLLPIAEFGKSYFEATIACENFKTRLCNNTNISTIFPYWSQSLQRDFFLVLNDVKEFHFNRFEYDAMQKVEDLRSRILFWLLYTASKIFHCQIITETNSTEFSRCETVQNFNNPSYKRLPFTSLKNSVKPSLLVKLKKLKRDLKSS